MGAGMRNAPFSTLLALVCLTAGLASAQRHPECIKYEVHEKVNVEPSQVTSLSQNCIDNNGFLENFAYEQFDKAGPVTFNTTFECCVSKPCEYDLECPFNFVCDLSDKRCKVANCELTDEVELISNEGADCLIDDDCGFEVPWDIKNWKCVAAPCPGGNCISRDKCKRCSTAAHSRNVPSRPLLSPDAPVPFTSTARPVLPAIGTISLTMRLDEMRLPEPVAPLANLTTSRPLSEATTAAAPVTVAASEPAQPVTERTVVNVTNSDELIATVVANDATTAVVSGLNDNATLSSATVNNSIELLASTISPVAAITEVSANETSTDAPVAANTNAPFATVSTSN